MLPEREAAKEYFKYKRLQREMRPDDGIVHNPKTCPNCARGEKWEDLVDFLSYLRRGGYRGTQEPSRTRRSLERPARTPESWSVETLNRVANLLRRARRTDRRPPA